MCPVQAWQGECARRRWWLPKDSERFLERSQHEPTQITCATLSSCYKYTTLQLKATLFMQATNVHCASVRCALPGGLLPNGGSSATTTACNPSRRQGVRAVSRCILIAPPPLSEPTRRAPAPCDDSVCALVRTMHANRHAPCCRRGEATPPNKQYWCTSTSKANKQANSAPGNEMPPAAMPACIWRCATAAIKSLHNF